MYWSTYYNNFKTYGRLHSLPQNERFQDTMMIDFHWKPVKPDADETDKTSHVCRGRNEVKVKVFRGYVESTVVL
jgi:hypothetical protein